MEFNTRIKKILDTTTTPLAFDLSKKTKNESKTKN